MKYFYALVLLFLAATATAGVELRSFVGGCVGESHVLTWTTEWEKNSDVFLLYEGVDTNYFERVVTAVWVDQEDTDLPQTYSITVPVNNPATYHLYWYGNISSDREQYLGKVTIGAPLRLPNPVAAGTRIDFSEQSEAILFNAAGQVITKSRGHLQLPTTAGLYLLYHKGTTRKIVVR